MMGCYYDQMMYKKMVEQRAKKVRNESRLDTLEKMVEELLRGINNLGRVFELPGESMNNPAIERTSDYLEHTPNYQDHSGEIAGRHKNNRPLIAVLLVVVWLVLFFPKLCLGCA